MIGFFACLALLSPSNPKLGRHLVFSYDFSKQTKLSPKDWTFDNGPVYNNEQEKYTSSNAKIENGSLVIEARKEGAQITSSRLESVKSWKYVYVESTARVPQGRGTWPAIWMLNQCLRVPGDKTGWPKCGEIDIMENVGFDPPNMHFSLHSQAFNWMQKQQRTSITAVSDPTAFHKFGLDWRPDSITFFLDDKAVYSVKKTDDSFASWPFRQPFYLILNLAIGGSWGGQKGVDPAIFPSRFEIRDVKVYQ